MTDYDLDSALDYCRKSVNESRNCYHKSRERLEDILLNLRMSREHLLLKFTDIRIAVDKAIIIVDSEIDMAENRCLRHVDAAKDAEKSGRLA